MKISSTEAIYRLFKKHPKLVTDSRKIENGCIFLALKGERFDGNLFAAQALEQGASYAIIDDAKQYRDERYLLVEDGLKALQDLANYHRRQFDIPIIGITGSNGKTTTKELVYAVLSSHYKCYATKGNLNNHIGVPLTLLALTEDIEVAVVEMGANHKGEIKALCEIAEPTHGLITNIGKAHLEGFGGLEGVKIGKSELYLFLKGQERVVFVNKDEAFLSELLGPYTKSIPYYASEDLSPDHYGYETLKLAEEPFLKAAFLGDKGQLQEVPTQLTGAYNFSNIMTAIALGRYFKVPTMKIVEGIASYLPANNRSQIIVKNSNTYILDAYNANPTSMRHALDNLSQQQGSFKMAILGDMLELGEFSQKEHHSIVEHCQTLGIDEVVLVGANFSAVEHFPEVRKFPDVKSLNLWYEKQDIQDRTILIKGSRGIALEQLNLK